MLEKKTRKKGIQIRGGHGTRGKRKGCQKSEKWKKRVSKSLLSELYIAIRSNVERVGNLRHVH